LLSPSVPVPPSAAAPDRCGSRNDPDPRGRCHARIDDHAPGGLGEDGDQRCPVTQFAQDLGLPLRGFRQHRVQRHHEGLVEFLDEREHIGSGLAAEDAVLVLDEHHVGAPTVQQRGHRHIVGPDVLPDDRQHLGFGCRMVVTHNRDDIDIQRGIDPEQGRPKIAGERADATGARRVRGDNCHSHGHRPAAHMINGTPNMATYPCFRR